MLIITLVHKLNSCKIDYISAFPQAPIERQTFTQIPPVMKVSGNPADYCLELHQNLSGQKQAGKVWHNYLLTKLKGIGFKQSENKPCVLYQGELIYVLYTNNTLLFGTGKSVTDKFINDLREAGLTLTVDGKFSDILGVSVKEKGDTIVFNQHFLTKQTISKLCTSGANTCQSVPVAELLQPLQNDQEFDKHFD